MSLWFHHNKLYLFHISSFSPSPLPSFSPPCTDLFVSYWDTSRSIPLATLMNSVNPLKGLVVNNKTFNTLCILMWMKFFFNHIDIKLWGQLLFTTSCCGTVQILFRDDLILPVSRSAVETICHNLEKFLKWKKQAVTKIIYANRSSEKNQILHQDFESWTLQLNKKQQRPDWL